MKTIAILYGDTPELQDLSLFDEYRICALCNDTHEHNSDCQGSDLS